MTPTGRITAVQFQILEHLVKRGHAMTGAMLRSELQKSFIGVKTFNTLCGFGYIRSTDQGFLVTDTGVVRVQEGYRRVV